MMKTTSAGADGRRRRKPATITTAPTITSTIGSAYGDATPRIAVKPADMKKRAPIMYQIALPRRYLLISAISFVTLNVSYAGVRKKSFFI
jgi:hypothetical protein